MSRLPNPHWNVWIGFNPFEVDDELPDELVGALPPWHAGKSVTTPEEELIAAVFRGYYEDILRGLTDPYGMDYNFKKTYAQLAFAAVREIMHGSGWKFWCSVANVEPERMRSVFEERLGYTMREIEAKLRAYLERRCKR